ncbi:MAG: hypothetical protein KDK41_03675 [Leptospiraceae bacterium]|nr:hypothetical protein [Leptospiraceae bacterium]
MTSVKRLCTLALLICLNSLLAQDLDNPFGEPDFKIQKEKNFSTFGFIRPTFRITNNSSPNAASDYLVSGLATLRLGSRWENEKWHLEGSWTGDAVSTNDMNSQQNKLTWSGTAANRFMHLESEKSLESVLLKQRVHRLYARYAAPKWAVSVGRLPVSWGEGRFLNPLNLITPIDPFLLDMEDLPGADLVMLEWFPRPLDSFTLVMVPTRTRDNNRIDKIKLIDSTFMAKYQKHILDSDISVLFGRHARSWTSAFEGVFDLDGTSLRGGYLLRMDDPRASSIISAPAPQQLTHNLLVGTSHSFYGKYRASAEIFFTSRACDKQCQNLAGYEAFVNASLAPGLNNDISFYATTGRILIRNPVLLQMSFGMNILVNWSIDSVYLIDIQSQSMSIIGFSNYSISEDLDFILGVWGFPFPGSENADFPGRRLEGFCYMRKFF